MAEYIEREALLNRIETHIKRITPIEESRDMFFHDSGVNGAIAGVRLEVEKASAADVAPVVHGRWIQEYRIDEMHYSPDDIERYKVPDGFSCSICSKWNSAKTNYCPNCGARMDGDRT